MCSELVKRVVLKSGLLKTRVDQKRCNKLSAGRAMAIATVERNLGIMQIIGCTLLCQSKSRGTLMISLFICQPASLLPFSGKPTSITGLVMSPWD